MCEQCIKEGFPCGKCENTIDASELAIDTEVFCEVCLTEFGGDENGLTYCCDICGRCGFCKDCSEPKNHDCSE